MTDKPTKDDELGMAWWNGMTDRERARWSAIAGNTGRAKDAWEAFKARPQWKRLGEMWSAEQAEHAHVPGYELTAFVIGADAARGWDREIGWEVHGGPKLLDLVARGKADSFDDAKAQAVAAWRALPAG
jgi:hypothetical protein